MTLGMIDYFTRREGVLAQDVTSKQIIKTVSERQIKVIHCLATARMELLHRNWDKRVDVAGLNNPCSLVSVLDYSCDARLKDGPDYEVQRQIVLQLVKDVIVQMSRGKYTEISEWEQAQTNEKNIIKALEKAKLNCVRSLV